MDDIFDVDDMAGIAELAELFCVTKPCVSNWTTRHKNFPKPVLKLSMGPIYSIAQVQRWIDERYEDRVTGAI